MQMEASGQRWMAFLSHFLPNVLRQSLPLHLKLTDRQPAGPRDLPVSASSVLELQAHATMVSFLMWLLGIEPKSLCLHGGKCCCLFLSQQGTL